MLIGGGTWADAESAPVFMELSDFITCTTMTLSCRSKNMPTTDHKGVEFIPGLFIDIMDSLAEVPILFPLCKMTDCQCQLVDVFSSCCTYSSVPQWYYRFMLWNPHNSATGTTNRSMTVIVMFMSIFKIEYFIIFIEWIIMVVILSIFWLFILLNNRFSGISPAWNFNFIRRGLSVEINEILFYDANVIIR